METLIQLGCPLVLTQTWQVFLFLSIPCVLAALGARLLQGSFLRIVGASAASMLRDLIILGLVSQGHPAANPHYTIYASMMLIYLVASGAALGAVFGPYRGPLLYLLAALGALVGQLLFEPLWRMLLLVGLGVYWLRSAQRRSSALPC
jgi:hypothetical protein